VHGVRRVERELEGDEGARGMAHDVRAFDAELAHEEPAVLRMVGHGDRPCDLAAAAEPRTVIAEQAVPIGERRLVQERFRPHRAHAPVDQNDRLPGSPQLVLELEPVDGRSRHLLHESPLSQIA
jgi:hypothetical protein